MTTFAEGFTEGLSGGIYLSREMRERKKARATQEAMSWLSEAETYDPRAGQFDPAAQAVPEEGQPARKSNQGYSGEDFAAIEKNYFNSLRGFTDMEEYGKAKLAWGAMKQSKINDAAMMAINAYDRGDFEGAQEGVKLASAYISPGFTPEVGLDHESGALLVANYDKAGNPTGGMALTRDDLVDFFRMNSGPAGVEAWADSNQRDEEFNRELGLQYTRFGAEQKERNQRMALAQNADERAEITARAQAATAGLQQQLLSVQLDDAERKSLQDQITNINKIITEQSTFNASEAARLRAESAQQGTFSGPTDPKLLAFEGSNNWAAVGPETKYGRARGRAQFIESRFNEAKAAGAVPTDMTFEQWGSDTPEGRAAQVNAEAWHWNDIDDFIRDAGLDSFLGQKDANGTPITWAGMRFAAHSGGKGGLEGWLKRGEVVEDVNHKGPADYMKLGATATPVGPDAPPSSGAVPEAEGTAMDQLNAVTDLDGKPIPDKYAVDPWMWNAPDATGKVTPRTEIFNAMELMAMDLKKNNPEASDMQVASMAMDAFGQKPRGVLDPAEVGSGEQDYYSDGVSKLALSPEVAELVGRFASNNEELRAAFEERANPKPYEVYTQEQSQEQAIPAPAPAPTPMPSAPAPGAAAAAAPPPQAAIPEPGAAAPPPTVDDTAVRTPRVPPELSGRPAPQAISDPYDLVRPHQLPPAGQYGAQVPLPKTIAQVPALAEAVRAWVGANLASGGPEEQAVRQAVSRLPADLQPTVMRELEMVMRMRRQ